jgi:hypothetical protein
VEFYKIDLIEVKSTIMIIKARESSREEGNAEGKVH